MPIKIFSPATISNLGPGFDLLGLAIHGLGDIVIAEKIAGNEIEFISDPKYPKLPSNQNNVVLHVANLVRNAYKSKEGMRITLQKNIPLSSGLGGSGASSAASAFAVNELLGQRFSRHALLQFALEGERLASGSAHADNVAPALLGGLCLMSIENEILRDVIQLPVKDNFFWSVVHPHCESETRAMRDLLPKNISLSEHTMQCSYFGLLLSGFLTGHPDWIKWGLHDHLIEPKRAQFIPGFSAVREAALTAGALGFSISGSGPSVFAVSDNQKMAENVGLAMQHAFLAHANLQSELFVSKINFTGTSRLE